jgi:Na+/melibiose symporter-like transporter
LGCAFQLLAIFVSSKRSAKRYVTVLHCINQLAFALIYVTPFLSLTRTQKTALFVFLLLVANALTYVVFPTKTGWLMSFVADDRRGRFTATKEIVSLLSGMIFSFAMGQLIDRFEAKGNLNGAFLTCGITVFLLMLLHAVTLLLAAEKPKTEAEDSSVGKQLRTLFSDKRLLLVILVMVLWHVARDVSVPFYGSYQIKELGFTMTFVSVLSAGYAVVRSLCSRPLGRFADRYSFASMLNICFGIMVVAFGINIFTVPQNGKVLYTVYYMLFAVAMAGINGATINLIYDYVAVEGRVAALALSFTLSGLIGFFSTLAVSPLVSYIQENGNRLFGIPVYAQQAVSALATVIMIVLLVYLNTIVRKLQKRK